MAPAEATFDVCVVGGCGRVGLPLGIALASRGLSVVLYDIDAAAVDLVNAGTLPFAEEGAAEPLAEALAAGRLRATTDPASVGHAEALVVVVGTPVDEHLNPDLGAVPRALERCAEHLRDGQLVVLRSTVYPGVTALTEKLLAEQGPRRRRGVLPGADRRGPGDDRAVRRCRRSSPPVPPGRWPGPRRCSGT